MTHLRFIAALTLPLVLGCEASTSGEGRANSDPEVASTGPGQTAAPEPRDDSPRQEAAEGFVLVPGGAELFATSDAKTPVLVLPSGARGIAFAAVRASGARLQIRSLDLTESSTHCGSEWVEATAFSLEGWIDRSDVLAVTTKNVTVRFDDGATATMPPGVGLSPSSEGANRYVVLSDFAPNLLLEVPKDSVGEFYEPGMLSPREAVVGLLPASASLSLGSEILHVADLGSREVFRNEPPLEGTNVIVGDRCLEVQAPSDIKPVAPEAVARRKAAALGNIGLARIIGQGGMFGLFEGFSVTPGAALTWRNGQPAGRLRATSINPTELIEDGDRRCFVLHDLELCVLAENVKSLESPTAPATPEESPQSVSETESDTKAIQRTIRSNSSVLQHCYQTQLKKNPTLEGKVVVHCTVEANGSVSRVQIDENTTNNANLSRCIRKKFKHLKFPKLEMSTEVSFPLVFGTAG